MDFKFRAKPSNSLGLVWHHVGPWPKPGWTDHLICDHPRYPGYPGCTAGASRYMGTRGMWGTTREVHCTRHMLASTLVYEVHGQRSQGVTSTYHQLNTQTLPSGKVETSDLVIISDVSQMSRQTVEFLFTHLNGKLLVTSDPISFQLLSDWFEIIFESQSRGATTPDQRDGGQTLWGKQKIYTF